MSKAKGNGPTGKKPTGKKPTGQKTRAVASKISGKIAGKIASTIKNRHVRKQATPVLDITRDITLPSQINIIWLICLISFRYIAWVATFIVLSAGIITWQLMQDRQVREWQIDTGFIGYFYQLANPDHEFTIGQLRIAQINSKLDILIDDIAINDGDALFFNLSALEIRFYIEDMFRGKFYPRYFVAEKLEAKYSNSVNADEATGLLDSFNGKAIVASVTAFYNRYPLEQIVPTYKINQIHIDYQQPDKYQLALTGATLNIIQNTQDFALLLDGQINLQHPSVGIQLLDLPASFSVNFHDKRTFDAQDNVGRLPSDDFSLQAKLQTNPTADRVRIKISEEVKAYGLEAKNLLAKLQQPLKINLSTSQIADSYETQIAVNFIGDAVFTAQHQTIGDLLIGDDLQVTGRLQQFNLLSLYAPIKLSGGKAYWANMPISGDMELALKNRRMKKFDMKLSGKAGIVRTAFFTHPFILHDWQLDGELIKRRSKFTEVKLNYREDVNQMNLVSNIQFGINASDKFFVNLDYRVADLPLQSVFAYWPEDYVPVTRQWFTDNIMAGVIEESTGRLSYGLNQDEELVQETLVGQVLLRDITGRADEVLPIFTDVDGKITFKDTNMELRFSQLKHPEITLDTDKSYVNVITTADDDIVLQTELYLSSGLPLLLDIAEIYEPSLQDYERHINGISGDATGTMYMQLSLQYDDDDKFELDINTDLAQVDFIIPSFSLKDGAGKLQMTGDALSLKADFAHGEETLSIDWQEDFFGASDVKVTGNLSASQVMVDIYHQLAVDFDGKIAMDVKYFKPLDKDGTISVNADMQDVSIAMAPLNIVKEQDEAGFMNLQGVVDDIGNIKFETVDIDFAGIKGDGTMLLDDDANVFVTLPTLNWGRTQFLLDGVVDKNNDAFFVMDGNAFDLSGLFAKGGMDWLLERLESDGSEPTPGIISIEGGIEKLYFIKDNDEQYTENASYLIYLTQYTTDMSWDMPYGEDGKEQLEIAFENDIRVKTGNLLMNMSSLSKFDTLISEQQNFAGGRLQLSSQRKVGDMHFAGRLETGELTIYGSPILGSVLEAISLITGNLSVFKKGYQTQGFFMDFLYDDRQRVIVENMRLYSLAQGITGSGVIDLGTSEVDLQGSVIPLYTLSVILGKTPILGPLLIGGEKDGLFGVRYWMTGPFDDVKARFNPLEALVPGFIKKFRDSLFTSAEEKALLENIETEKAKAKEKK